MHLCIHAYICVCVCICIKVLFKHNAIYVHVKFSREVTSVFNDFRDKFFTNTRPSVKY